MKSYRGLNVGNPEIDLLGHACDIATLNREGLNEVTIAPYLELHG